MNAKVPYEEHEYDPEYTAVHIKHCLPLELALDSPDSCRMLLSYQEPNVTVKIAAKTPLQTARHNDPEAETVMDGRHRHPNIDTRGDRALVFAQSVVFTNRD